MGKRIKLCFHLKHLKSSSLQVLKKQNHPAGIGWGMSAVCVMILLYYNMYLTYSGNIFLYSLRSYLTSDYQSKINILIIEQKKKKKKINAKLGEKERKIVCKYKIHTEQGNKLVSW